MVVIISCSNVVYQKVWVISPVLRWIETLDRVAKIGKESFNPYMHSLPTIKATLSYGNLAYGHAKGEREQRTAFPADVIE
ncbi:MAG: hypothetical protein F6K50_12960 [Moorea sp. SIO3I7]|nr:hypothetical protein [Moorena sp. SIO3I7]